MISIYVIGACILSLNQREAVPQKPVLETEDNYILCSLAAAGAQVIDRYIIH